MFSHSNPPQLNPYATFSTSGSEEKKLKIINMELKNSGKNPKALF